MRRRLLDIAALTLAASFAAMPSMAQNAPNGPQGGRGGGPGRPHTMDLASAKKILAAAESAAQAANDHIAICVMDTNGDVVLSERMDTLPDSIPLFTAQGKANAVLLLGISTGQAADAIRDHKPVSATLSAPPVARPGGEITLMRGGLPVMKDGKMIGSVGVGGSTSDNDEKYAQIGIDALAAK